MCPSAPSFHGFDFPDIELFGAPGAEPLPSLGTLDAFDDGRFPFCSVALSPAVRRWRNWTAVAKEI